MSLKILLSGATGAVGRSIEALAEAEPGLEIAGRASRSEFFGDNQTGDVVVDFSVPSLCAKSVEFALARGMPMVIGTTGLGDELVARIRSGGERIPVCQAANFSVGVHVLTRIAADAAGTLGEAFDIEILDIHHRRKRDAPSGTALALGRAVADARGIAAGVADRMGTAGPRDRDEIGYQAVRGGDLAGEHTVFLLGDGERLELTHRATDRSIFARGALRAAGWLVDRPPGLYGMDDVLGED